jgi:hypothetical protein
VLTKVVMFAGRAPLPATGRAAGAAAFEAPLPAAGGADAFADGAGGVLGGVPPAGGRAEGRGGGGCAVFGALAPEPATEGAALSDADLASALGCDAGYNVASRSGNAAAHCARLSFNAGS